MPLVNLACRDSGGLQRDIQPGDIIDTGEIPLTLNNAAGVTLSGQQLMASILLRTGPAGAYSDTTPDASTLINAMLGQASYQAQNALTGPLGADSNSSFRLRYNNGGGGTMTLVAGNNVTLVGTTTIVTTAWREYLIRVTNGTPQAVFAATTTNASAVITGLTAWQTQLLTAGMAVSGTGIPAATTILSVQPGVGVTLSANATATGSLVALTFNPTVIVQSLGTYTA